MTNTEKESDYEKAFNTIGFKRSWAKYERIIDEFPFDDPMDAVAWKEEMKRNKFLRFALNKHITEWFMASYKSRFRPERNFIFSVYGPPGAGKTTFNAMLIWEGLQIYPDASYSIADSYDEIISGIVSLPEHSIISYDENLEPTGKGSRIIMVHLENLLKMLRKYGINIIFNFKQEENLGIAKYHFELFGYNRETGESRALVQNWKRHYIGYIVLKKQFPPEFYAPFEREKDDTMKTLKKNRGKITAFSEFNIDDAVQRGKEIVQDAGISLNRDKDIEEILEMDETLEIPPTYLEKVARRIRILLKKEKPTLFVQPKTSDSKDRLPCTLLEEYKDTTFLPRVLKHLLKRGMAKVKVNVFALKCQQESNLDIHKRLDISTGSVSNYFHSITGKELGYAGEDARDDVLTEQDIPHKKGGYNTPEPDQIIYEPHHVESVKTYYIHRISKAAEEIGKEETAYAQQHECPLILRVFECYTQKFYVYRVQLEPLNHHQSSSCEVRNAQGDEHPLSPPPPPPCDSRNAARPAPGVGGAQEDTCEPRKKTKKKRRGKR